jgi:serine/threonine-protein kinase
MTAETLPTLLGGRYRLERRLGRGGMAVVHLAQDTVLERPVAVKLLAERFGDDEELRERFLREGRFAAKLSHPHVVGVFDTGEEDGRPYIVMEFVDGATLAEELEQRRTFAPEDVAELGRQAASGLQHAHAAGLVHRDVKPQNLLLRRDGILKVADFGIARGGVGGTITQAGTLLGTAAYMAPEVARGDPATAAADIYSLGAVLYELLTGVPPRRVDTLADLVAEQPIPHPREHVPDPPPGLAATILRCLDDDPLHRPVSAGELALELGGAPAAGTTRRLAPAWRVQRTRPRRLWLAVAAAAVTAVVLALSTLGGEDETPAGPAPVEPVPVGSTPAEDARNLADWLRENARS